MAKKKYSDKNKELVVLPGKSKGFSEDLKKILKAPKPDKDKKPE